MTAFQVTKTLMQNGEWHGHVTGPVDAPLDLEVTHENRPVAGVEFDRDDAADHWTLVIPIPTSAIADGVQTLVIRNSATQEALGHIALMAGEVLGDDMRAEMALLRAELETLKRAFRRHCAETG